MKCIRNVTAHSFKQKRVFYTVILRNCKSLSIIKVWQTFLLHKNYVIIYHDLLLPITNVIQTFTFYFSVITFHLSYEETDKYYF